MRHFTYHDGGRAEITDDGAWDLTLPNSRHVRGQAPNVAAAEVAIEEARKVFILAAWANGSLAPRQKFLCPLN